MYEAKNISNSPTLKSFEYNQIFTLLTITFSALWIKCESTGITCELQCQCLACGAALSLNKTSPSITGPNVNFP